MEARGAPGSSLAKTTAALLLSAHIHVTVYRWSARFVTYSVVATYLIRVYIHTGPTESMREAIHGRVRVRHVRPLSPRPHRRGVFLRLERSADDRQPRTQRVYHVVR